MRQEIKKSCSEQGATKGWQHKAKNGELLEVDITSFEVKFLEKKAAIVKAVNITQQIKETKILTQQQLGLAKSEEIYRLITSSAKDAIILMDIKGHITQWNNAAEKILGYTKKEAIGMPLYKILDSSIEPRNH